MPRFSRQARWPGQAPVQISEKSGVRFLHLGGPPVQSAMRLREPFALELEYTRAMLAFLLFHHQPEEGVLIGLGGGSIAKFIHRHLSTLHLTAIEINPQVVMAARSYFLLPADDERLTVITGDGADFVYRQDASLDVLMVDGYDALRIVEDLASPPFYQACRKALRPGGVAVFNLWGSDARFAIYRARIERAFELSVLFLPTEQKGNIIAFAFNPPLPELNLADLHCRATVCQSILGLEFPRFLQRMRHYSPVSDGVFLV